MRVEAKRCSDQVTRSSVFKPICRHRDGISAYLGGVRGLSSENSVCKSSLLNGPGSRKLPCKSTLHCRFCLVEWQIFRLGDDSLTYPHEVCRFCVGIPYVYILQNCLLSLRAEDHDLNWVSFNLKRSRLI